MMTKARSPALPNVPTAEEQGTKGMEAYTWNALYPAEEGYAGADREEAGRRRRETKR